MSTPVEQIKARLSIVDVVGSYIKLTKAGGSYKALCPFHHEKSPSFNVSPARDAYYCFGCNKGGDIFTFVEEIEGVDFMGALKTLADRAGVELKQETGEMKRERTERERLLSIMEDATAFYEARLAKEHLPMEYLKSRGLLPETIEKFRIGFAPVPSSYDEWDVLFRHLKVKGYQPEEIEKSGMAKKGDRGGYYDRFRGRIIFPIFDVSGRPIAVSGRIFGTQRTPDGSEPAKYVNSPETPLFDKSSVLFGYNFAKANIRKQNFCVFVEGQVDLIMSHQAGMENTVAVSGTALTEQHLSMVKRLTENIVFAFDADPAGLKATARAFSMALSLGMSVRVARIPEGKDPADFIIAHPDAWGSVISESTHIIDFYLSTLSAEVQDPKELRAKVSEHVLPLVIEIRSKIEQAHYIIEIARKLGVPEDAVWEDVKRLGRASSVLGATSPAGVVISGTPPKSRRQVVEEEIIGILTWQESSKEPALNAPEKRAEYEGRLKNRNKEPLRTSKDEELNLLLKAEHTYEEGPKLRDLFDELLDTLEMELLREEQSELWRKLSDAENAGKKDEAKKYLQAYQAINPLLLAIEDRRQKRNSAELKQMNG
jgi:DNA primase